MKARVKHNNEIIDVIQVGTKTHLYDLNNVEFIDAPQDYWERLRHEYAGMAMQGMLSNAVGFDAVRKEAADNGINNLIVLIAGAAIDYATALVNKLKEERK